MDNVYNMYCIAIIPFIYILLVFDHNSGQALMGLVLTLRQNDK